LALLIAAADLLVRGVSALAQAAGVPPLVVGLTIVAFGTSLPEVVINSLSAVHGQTELAFGNIVGSSTINIGFVLAMTAIVRPLTVKYSIILREIPMMLLGVAALLLLSSDHLFNGAADNQLVRSDGLVLLLFFCVFLYYVIMDAVRREQEPAAPADALVEAVERNLADPPALVPAAGVRPISISILMTLGGLVGVAIGGRLVVAAAVKIAEAMQVPQVIIGLTVVSFGTTLPELATSVVATRRGQSDLALGNVIGSNIFNILFIGGLCSIIAPIRVPLGGELDLIFLFGLCALLLPVVIRGPRRVTRGEGILIFSGYLAYTLWRTFFSTQVQGV
jgi:cation:H+ antiporter